MDRPGQPPEGLGRGRQRGRPDGGRRNPQARRRQEFRPGAAAQPQCRAAGAAPLLADLRGGRGSRASGRRPRLRLWRQSDHGLGLAELLHRGDGGTFAVPADRAGEPGAGGRVRAASDAEDDHDRGRLRLGAVAGVAARQDLAAAEKRGAACQAPAVGIYPRAHLVDHAADGRPGEARSSVRRDRLGRLGQAVVRDRLSALGLRRSVAGAARRRQRRQPRGVLSAQRAEAVRSGLMVRHVIAPVDELPPGTRKFLTIDERPIAVFNIKGEFFGLLNRCPHQGAALCEGPLIGLAQSSDPGEIEYTRLGEIIRCPWHGWEFDIRTGQSYCEPKRFRARAYPVNVEPGTSVVKGPYIAETLKVAVESDYVVVDL